MFPSGRSAMLTRVFQSGTRLLGGLLVPIRDSSKVAILPAYFFVSREPVIKSDEAALLPEHLTYAALLAPDPRSNHRPSP